MLPVLTAATGRLTTHIILQSKVEIRMGFPNKLGKAGPETRERISREFGGRFESTHLERKKIYEGHAKGADMRPPLVAEVRGFIFSLDYYIEGDMAAEKIPKDVKNLWEEWNIRVLIIFSLSLQVILVVFSPSRKRTSGKLFVFLIWFAYLLADWSANYTIGQISDTQDEEDGDQGWTLCALLAPMNDVRSKRSE
ncbi:BnaC09g52950D [Brassica napus]|uniref:BnaC09g52950D protein n=1 Tax=Brassica napus TaxID=3708 RepID=A0A078J3K7_BRANA|nr:BnaC09g52950D [Brassica napus]